MKEHFKATPIPESIEEFEDLVRNMFEDLTHHSIDSTDIIKIEKYNRGGMSGGGISTEFCNNSALPLLRRRFSQTGK